MIRYSVLYANEEGATFDHDYYRDVHVPLVASTWGLERVEIDKGIDGPYLAGVHLFFDTLEAWNTAQAHEGTAAIRADVANYTNVTPELQLSEVV